MTSVGVLELRQRASELLRLVRQGETIEITDRGRPVAVLAPLPDAGPLERLRAAGDVQPSVGDLDELPPPLPSRGHARLRRCWPNCGVTSAGDRHLPRLLRPGEVGHRGARVGGAAPPPNDRVLSAAGTLRPPELRTLDAIHLATAQALGADLGLFVAYDLRLLQAAEGLGLRTAMPG